MSTYPYTYASPCHKFVPFKLICIDLIPEFELIYVDFLPEHGHRDISRLASRTVRTEVSVVGTMAVAVRKR